MSLSSTIPSITALSPLSWLRAPALWLGASLLSVTLYATPQATPDVSPPLVLSRVDARYPSDALLARRGGQVTLTVVVLSDGSVGEVEVSASAGAELDQAAVIAVRQWRFTPAMRGGLAVASKIRVPFSFTPPQPVITTPPLPPAQPEALASPEEEEAIEVTVQGERSSRPPRRSVSDFKISGEELKATPKQEGAEVLRAAPGLYIGRGEGLAVAHNYMLRGFDAEHGQDIEFKVGGLPINLPSHIHGQGYSDLGFLIGDVVQELKVSEGVYDPRQGDFAVAGSLELSLGVADADRGAQLRASYGAFNSAKQSLIWAPEGMGEESFVAAQLSSTDGFGERRAGRSGSAMLQHRFGEGAVTYRLIALMYAARADLAGVLRYDDIGSSGAGLCWLCAYPEPSAQAQNALANRAMGGFFVDYDGAGGEGGQLGVWASYDHFHAQNNFTGFTQTSRLLERVGGRGDLLEQQSDSYSLGLTGRYRARPARPTSWLAGTLELGVDGRVDDLEQSQHLLDASLRNQVWDRRVDASIKGADLGLWGDLEGALFDDLKLRAGLRADLLSYSVDDRLSNLPPLTRPQADFIPGYRRSALGLAWGPRASLEYPLTDALSTLLAYGEGYRSPQARTLEDGEEAPYTKVRSTDVGLRFQPSPALQLTVGGYLTRLSDDVSFEAEEGRLERVGATQRLGGVINLVTRPWPWLVGSLSVTYVDATLLEPPPATAEEPQPAFTEGQQLPFVPPLVARADLSARRALPLSVFGEVVTLRGGLGFSYLSPRPLTYGERSSAMSLLDLSTALDVGPVGLSVELFNALDQRYAALEYVYPSDWDPSDGVRPRTPARHLSAGAPRTWMLSIEVHR